MTGAGQNSRGDDGKASGIWGRPCPICGKPAKAEVKPFCSKRCADVDLHRWLGGVYALPAGEQDGLPDDEEPVER